jgi:hypothetical protein
MSKSVRANTQRADAVVWSTTEWPMRESGRGEQQTATEARHLPSTDRLLRASLNAGQDRVQIHSTWIGKGGEQAMIEMS